MVNEQVYSLLDIVTIFFHKNFIFHSCQYGGYFLFTERFCGFHRSFINRFVNFSELCFDLVQALAIKFICVAFFKNFVEVI